jgi:hypothetical protein
MFISTLTGLSMTFLPWDRSNARAKVKSQLRTKILVMCLLVFLSHNPGNAKFYWQAENSGKLAQRQIDCPRNEPGLISWLWISVSCWTWPGLQVSVSVWTLTVSESCLHWRGITCRTNGYTSHIKFLKIIYRDLVLSLLVQDMAFRIGSC